MKNIVLLGGSNSVMVNGLQKGLREYANVTNLALGGTTSLQNLYELKRSRNQEIIQNANLIITESVINELDNHNIRENLSLEIIFKNLQYLYATLYELKKPVCILVLPYRIKNYQIIINMHRFLANYYGVNIVDMQSYYQNNEIISFGNKFGGHQLAIVNRYVGKEIAKNIDKFKVSNKKLDINLPDFKILTPENMKKAGNFKIFNPNNSMYNEIAYRLENGNNLSFNNCDGYQIIGVHSWNLEPNGEITKLNFGIATAHCASIHIKKADKNIVKPTSKLNIFCEIQAEPIIDNNFIAKFNDNNLPYTEFYIDSFYDTPESVLLNHFDLIAFFLCKPNPKMKLFDLSVIPSDTDIKIDPELDCSHLIPNIVFFKDSMEFIDEYIGHLYPNITRHIDSVLTPQIIQKAQAQILSQLSQNTTQTQQSTLNSQLPLEAENKILKEKIAKLENECQKALKLKNHLSYKLGQALIKANKTWYKGGYIKFIFEAIRIKKEHKTIN